ncbi:MAG: hypothetical protein J7647_25380 [Cyanobacteria bacterium SBLK]|nr:hypothetical protein [Cyanobacteria bacterium SBLK]
MSTSISITLDDEMLHSPTTVIAPILRNTKILTDPFIVNVVATAQNGLDGDRPINLSQIQRS